MSMQQAIEEESGTVTQARHPHRGYYAGDFSGAPFRPAVRSSEAYVGAGPRYEQTVAWAPTR